MSSITNYQSISYTKSYNYASAASTSATLTEVKIAAGASTSGSASGSGTKPVEIENLSVSDITTKFKTGNLTTAEMEKWLTKNKLVTNWSKVEYDNLVSYDFVFNKKTYNVSCTKEAAKSSTDNKTQTVYTQDALKKKGFSEEIIDKYFIIAFSTGKTKQYALRPDCGFKTIGELDLYVNRDKYQFELDGKINKVYESMNAITKAMEDFKNGKVSFKDIKKLLSFQNSQILAIENYANSHKLTDTTSMRDFKEKFNNEFSSKMNDEVSNALLNGNISEKDAGTLFNYLNSDKSLEAKLDELIDKLKSNSNKYSAADIVKLVNYYTQKEKISNSVKDDLIKELTDKIKKGENIDAEYLADKIKNTEAMCTKKDKIISSLEYYINLTKKYVSQGNKNALLNLLPKLTGLSLQIMDFVNAERAKDVFNFKESIQSLKDKLDELIGEINQSDYIDSKTIEQLEQTSTSVAKAMTYSYDNVMKIVDRLFSNKETVTVDELIEALEKSFKNAGEKTTVNIEDLKSIIQDMIENGQKTFAGSRGQRRGGMAASQARLLALLNRLNEVDLTGEVTILMLKQELSKNADDEYDYNSAIDDILNEYNTAEDEIAKEVASIFGIPSGLMVPVDYITDKLKVMFAGREDIRKDEVVNALRNIYTTFAMANKIYDMNKKIENDNENAYGIENVTKDMSNYFDAIGNINLTREYDFIGAFVSVISSMSNILEAISKGDYRQAARYTEELQNKLNEIHVNVKDNIAHDSAVNGNKKSGGQEKTDYDNVGDKDIDPNFETNSKAIDDYYTEIDNSLQEALDNFNKYNV